MGVRARCSCSPGIAVAQQARRWWPLLLALGTFAAVELAILALKVAIGREGPGEQAQRDRLSRLLPVRPHRDLGCLRRCAGVPVHLRPRPVLPGSSAPPASPYRSGLVVGAISAWRAVLGDFHWFADGIGGLLVALVVMLVSFSVCRRNLLREAPVQPVDEGVRHELE